MVAGWLATKAFDKVVIITTALLGSYSLINGISSYVGHYYNPFIMAKLV